VDRDGKQRHHWHAERAAADPHHARHAADSEGDELAADAARHRVGDVPAFERQQHLDRDEQRDDAEHRRQHVARHARGEDDPRDRAEEDSDAPAAKLDMIDRALRLVRARRGNGGRDDRRQRGRNRDMHPHRRIDAERGEHEVEYRHDNDAAADAQHARDHAADRPGQQHHRRQRQQFRIQKRVHRSSPKIGDACAGSGICSQRWKMGFSITENR